MDTNYYVDTSYGYNAATSSIAGAMLVFMILMMIIGIALSIIMIISLWKIFTKSGKPGWASIVPIYNIYVMCEIAEVQWWHILLLCVPIVNIYAMFVLCNGIAKKFDKTTGFTIGMLLLPMIFLPILAFGKNNVTVSDAHYEVGSETLSATNNESVEQVSPQNTEYNSSIYNGNQASQTFNNNQTGMFQNGMSQSVSATQYDQMSQPVNPQQQSINNPFVQQMSENLGGQQDFAQFQNMNNVKQHDMEKTQDISGLFQETNVQNQAVNQKFVAKQPVITQSTVQANPMPVNNLFEQNIPQSSGMQNVNQSLNANTNMQSNTSQAPTFNGFQQQVFNQNNAEVKNPESVETLTQIDSNNQNNTQL